MTREDITTWAREVGWIDYDLAEGREMRLVMFAEHFAALVAAAEREACAKVCEDDQSQAGEWTAESHVGGYFAARIRARGRA